MTRLIIPTRTAQYVALRASGLNQSETARWCKVTRQAVSVALRKHDDAAYAADERKRVNAANRKARHGPLVRQHGTDFCPLMLWTSQVVRHAFPEIADRV